MNGYVSRNAKKAEEFLIYYKIQNPSALIKSTDLITEESREIMRLIEENPDLISRIFEIYKPMCELTIKKETARDCLICILDEKLGKEM